MATDLLWQRPTACTMMTTRSCFQPAPFPSCLASTTGGRPRSQRGDYDTTWPWVMLLIQISTRRQIRVSKVLVHENFTNYANDIALLRLGKNGLVGDPFFNQSKWQQLTEERVDLSVFSPACLPDAGENFVDQNGHVYGEQHQPMKKLQVCI